MPLHTNRSAPPRRRSARLQHRRRGGALGWVLLAVAAAAATFALLWLLTDIFQKKQDARNMVLRTVELKETTTDPAVWGRDFPNQYDSYRRTVDVQRTRHGGSEAFQKLDEHPVWRDIWAGYAFATDFREERGHAYMLTDQRQTERVKQFKQPGACLHCHASVLEAYRAEGIAQGAPGGPEEPLLSANGQAQLRRGWESLNPRPYAEVTAKVSHPVACVDCHDPGTMALRVTRPAALDAFAALAAGEGPVAHLPSMERWRTGDRRAPYDPNALASRQEMRSLVCAQCHVEYHFAGPEKRLTYPWGDGLGVERILGTYDRSGFADWTHAITGAPVLKAQHPEFEMWSQGVHAAMGVSCADCHMPYTRVGGMKVSSHHVRSPLLDVAASCQNCHPQSAEQLMARVQRIQDTTQELLRRGETAVAALIADIAAARSAGATDEALKEARAFQRRAQFMLDFVSAENSSGFHAPQEAARILAASVDLARQGQLALGRAGGARPPA